jgi:hypothetical protein
VRRRIGFYPAAIDTLAPSDEIIVILIRAWYENEQLRARVTFAPRTSGARRTVVVGSVDDIHRIVVDEIESKRPGAPPR